MLFYLYCLQLFCCLVPLMPRCLVALMRRCLAPLLPRCLSVNLQSDMRQLAAILFADMTGYTALMQENEQLARRKRQDDDAKVFQVLSRAVVHEREVTSRRHSHVACSPTIWRAATTSGI